MIVRLLGSEGGGFVIAFPGPTLEQLRQIDGPDIEGQTDVYEVFADRKLAELASVLRDGYRYEYDRSAVII